MTETVIANLKQYLPNPEWAKLPLFDRKGWQRLPFGAFAESINERVEPANAAEEIYVGLDDLDSGSLHVRRWGKGSDVIGTKLRFRKGELIFGRRRAYQRKLAVAEMDGICSAHAMVVRAKPGMVLPEFLPFLMMSDKFMNRAVEISVGSLSPTINWTTLKLQEFDLPTQDQQQRIAEILWAVDDLLQHSLKLLRNCAESELTVFEAHTGEKSGNKWPMVELEQVISKFIDYRGKSPRKTDEGIPLITAKNVRAGYIDEEPREYIASDEYDAWMRRGIPSKEDLLFTTEAPLGNVARVPSYKFALAQRIICLAPNTLKIHPAFLYWGMRSSAVQNKIRQKATGTTVLGIKQSNLRKVLFPLPERHIQLETAVLCDSLAKNRELIESYLKNLEVTRSALLNSLVSC